MKITFTHVSPGDPKLRAAPSPAITTKCSYTSAALLYACSCGPTLSSCHIHPREYASAFSAMFYLLSKYRARHGIVAYRWPISLNTTAVYCCRF
eukprot:3335415-Rhodomonas_salina.2